MSMSICFTFLVLHTVHGGSARMTGAPNIHFYASIHEMTAALSTMTNAISLKRLGGSVWFEVFLDYYSKY